MQGYKFTVKAHTYSVMGGNTFHKGQTFIRPADAPNIQLLLKDNCLSHEPIKIPDKTKVEPVSTLKKEEKTMPAEQYDGVFLDTIENLEAIWVTKLKEAGYDSAEKVLGAKEAELMAIDGFGKKTIDKIVAICQEAITEAALNSDEG